MEPTLTPQDLHCVANAITHCQYAATKTLSRPCTAHDINFGGSCFNCGYDPQRVAQPITNQDLAKTSRDARLVERVAWCDRAHESIQTAIRNCDEEVNWKHFALALDLQSIALDSIIHWTQPEYYR